MAPRTDHPRTLGWFGTSALAMGGSNQSLFLIGALVASQGTGAVPLLIIGLLLSWAATPGWIELVLMWPNRVGGIAATCAEAFRPYARCSPTSPASAIGGAGSRPAA
jgi:two-component system, sensor histidine kinase